MKTKMYCKSIFALLLAVVMVVSVIPATALTVFAVDTEGYYYEVDFTTLTELPTSKPSEGGVYSSIATLSEDGATLGSTGWLYFSPASTITANYTVEFVFQLLTTESGKSSYIKFGHGVESTNYDCQFQVAANGGDRIGKVYDGTESKGAAYFDSTTTKQANQVRHVKVVVDQESETNTYQLYLDGRQIEFSGDSVFATYNNKDGFNTFGFQMSSSVMLIKSFKFYTEGMEGAYDWTVNQQAALGENIGFTFTGKAGTMTGITQVRATVGDTVVAEDVTDGAYSVTLPVAASQMGETITLEGLNAEGTAVKTESYTVAQYLDAVKATDETTYGNIVNHTLNYGSAAAAYFSGAAVTAPEGLTLADVPDARKGDNITVNGAASGLELNYWMATAITGEYTVEFKYQLQNAYSNVAIKIGPNNTSTTMNLWVQLQGGAAPLFYHTAYNTTNKVTLSTSSYTKVNEWHTFKVTASANKTFKLWLDGTLITTETYADGAFPCFTDSALKVVTFDMSNVTSTARTMMIDDFNIYSGDGTGEPYYSDNFETFQPVTTAPADEDAWIASASAAVLNYKELETPVSGSCTGVTANSANLLFEDQVKIRYKVTLDAGKNISDYTIKVGGEAVTEVVSAGSNVYYIYSQGINPQQYGDDFALTVSDGTNTLTVSYCALDYIQRMSAKDSTNANLKTLLKAMYNYYLAAEAYVSN